MQTTIKQFIQPDNYCMPENVKANIHNLLTPYNYRCMCHELLTTELQIHSLYQLQETPTVTFAIASTKCPNCGEEVIFITNLCKVDNRFLQADSKLFINLHELQLLATYIQELLPPTVSSNPLQPHLACRQLPSTLLKYHLYKTINKYNKADISLIKHSVNTHSLLEYNYTCMGNAEKEILDIIRLAHRLFAMYNYNLSSNLITDFLFSTPANFSQKYMK